MLQNGDMFGQDSPFSGPLSGEQSVCFGNLRVSEVVLSSDCYDLQHALKECAVGAAARISESETLFSSAHFDILFLFIV